MSNDQFRQKKRYGPYAGAFHRLRGALILTIAVIGPTIGAALRPHGLVRFAIVVARGVAVGGVLALTSVIDAIRATVADVVTSRLCAFLGNR